jgi:hypothetical protein
MFNFEQNVDSDWLVQNVDQLFDIVAGLLKSKDEKVNWFFYFKFNFLNHYNRVRTIEEEK